VITKLLHTTPTDLAQAAALLREGELVAFPTETVYGLGAHALDEEAVRKVYEVKGRPQDNPMIVHVSSKEQAKELMQEVPLLFDELANEFWPGPLTLIVKRNAAVPDIVAAGLDTVAVRMPDHAVARELLNLAGVPVAAPSANISGKPSPTDAATVYADLQGKISAVVDGGSCPLGIESTVLDLTVASPVILRPGIVTREDLEDVIQSNVFFADTETDVPRSPGTKYRHYAPAATLVLIAYSSDEARQHAVLRRHIEEATAEGKRLGLLAPDRFSDTGEHSFFSLGAGTAVDYARGLYAGLRALDSAEVDEILCPGIEAEGVGYAVMNRLLRAGEITGGEITQRI
jgi:L-threonylcarbamoyladenylate synthase